MNDTLETNGKKGFLGRGWRFPVSVGRVTGKIEESVHEESIAESIKLILGTSRGERVMNPEFGCGLRGYTFAEMNYTTLSEIEADVKNALVLWEPRIIDVEVNCRNDGAVLYVNISYVVRSTNNPFNLVYPFYLNEN